MILTVNFLCKKGSPYSITERWVPELILVLGSWPAGDVSYKPSGRSAAITFHQACSYPISLLSEQRQDGCEQFA